MGLFIWLRHLYFRWMLVKQTEAKLKTIYGPAITEWDRDEFNRKVQEEVNETSVPPQTHPLVSKRYQA
jgi:hypothetical protein